jgi:hypothetical protein
MDDWIHRVEDVDQWRALVYAEILMKSAPNSGLLLGKRDKCRRAAC